MHSHPFTRNQSSRASWFLRQNTAWLLKDPIYFTFANKHWSHSQVRYYLIKSKNTFPRDVEMHKITWRFWNFSCCCLLKGEKMHWVHLQQDCRHETSEMRDETVQCNFFPLRVILWKTAMGWDRMKVVKTTKWFQLPCLFSLPTLGKKQLLVVFVWDQEVH